MQARSTFTHKLDPYRAGVEIGEALEEISPEVVFLFSSIHYQGSPELLEGIYEVLDNPDLVLVGGTGDGFYEHSTVSDVGASALALNSGGAVRWHLARRGEVGQRPHATTQDCLADLESSCAGRDPSLFFLFTDFRTDTSEILRALQEGAPVPVVGGSAGDAFDIESCFVYANREVLTDHLVMLAAEGEFHFDIHLSCAAQPVGSEGVLTDVEGTEVRTIDDLPAGEFLQNQMGKAVHKLDLGNVTLQVLDSRVPEERRLRSIDSIAVGDRGSVTLFGGIEQGNRVQLCLTRTDRMLSELRDLGEKIAETPFEPVAALVVSCSGRKQLLAREVSEEIRAITACPGAPPHLAGITSLGEFGPVRLESGYSRPLYHNMSFILVLIG